MTAIHDCAGCEKTTRTNSEDVTQAPPWREIWEHDGKGGGAETFLFCSIRCLIAWAEKREKPKVR